MLTLIITALIGLYAIVGLLLARHIWASEANDMMREAPELTDLELKRQLFTFSLFLWPVLITKIKVERSEGFGIDVTFDKDDDDDGPARR